MSKSYLEQMQKHFKNNNKSKEYSAHSGKVHTIGWSKDGKRLASGSYDQTVCVFSLDRDKLVCLNYFYCFVLLFSANKLNIKIDLIKFSNL